MTAENGNGQVEQLPVSLVHPNPDQPRKQFDKEGLDKLAASIVAAGRLLSPITVRPDPAGGYMIVVGERRWRAISSLGWQTIGAIVDDVDDATSFMMAMIENVSRQDMNALEEATGYQKLMELGHSEEEVSKMFGHRPGFVTRRIGLLKLAPDVQELVVRNVLPWSMGAQMVNLSANGQHEVLRKLTAGKLDQVEVTQLVTGIEAREASRPIFSDAEMQKMKPTRETKQSGEAAWEAMNKATAALRHLADFDDHQIAAGLVVYPQAEETAQLIEDGMHRIATAIRRRRARLLADPEEGQSVFDLGSRAAYTDPTTEPTSEKEVA